LTAFKGIFDILEFFPNEINLAWTIFIDEIPVMFFRPLINSQRNTTTKETIFIVIHHNTSV